MPISDLVMHSSGYCLLDRLSSLVGRWHRNVRLSCFRYFVYIANSKLPDNAMKPYTPLLSHSPIRVLAGWLSPSVCDVV